MTGHATSSELQEIQRLEANLDLSLNSVDDLMQLALLYMEPAHREEEAIQLLEAVISRDPLIGEARIWLAYVLLHYKMDSVSLSRAIEVLTPLLEDPTFDGPASMMVAEVLEEQGADLGDRIQFLEMSVAKEPSWVNNRQDLAWAYSASGRSEDARRQLELALGSVRRANPAWGVHRRNFEESITGRTAFGVEERLRSDIQDLSS